MTDSLQQSKSPSEKLDSFALNKQGNDNENCTSYVEFRNIDTTEVEVKESSQTYNVDKLCLSRGVTIKKLQTENRKLKEDLKRAGVDLESSRRTFEAVTEELKRQLDVANKRESEGIERTLGLRLENEKLYVLLESKQSLVDKLKKELLNVKRALKMAIKDICTRASEYPDGGHHDNRAPQSARSPRSPRVRFADSLDSNLDIPLKSRHEI